jgi:hypothetical protein
MEETSLIDVVVLVHGIDDPLGSEKDMLILEQNIKHYFSGEKTNLSELPVSNTCSNQSYSRVSVSSEATLVSPARNLITICSSVNTGKTLTGIESSGRRLACEILEVVSHFDEKVKFFFSIIGHSLGGLFARNCLKHLFEENITIWKRLIPVSFITLSSPHLGVRRPSATGLMRWRNKAIDISGRLYFRGPTMKEMLLEDGDLSMSEKNQPLLWQMALPESNYMKPLKQFRYRTLFSIVKGDFQVPYCSASMSSENPYDRSLPIQIPTTGMVRNHSGFSEKYCASIFDPMQTTQHSKLVQK